MSEAMSTEVLPVGPGADPAQDEGFAYTLGVQAYISAFPMLDLYRTLWETSFDPARGHDRTLNEFFMFDRLVTSDDDWVITPNEDTIYSRAFFDIRKEPLVLVIPPMGDRKFWVPIADMRHDFQAILAWDNLPPSGGTYALVPAGWKGLLPDGIQRIEIATPIGWMLPRFAVSGREDVAAAHALQTQVRLVPLSQWGNANPPRPNPDPSDFPRFTRADLADAPAVFTVLNHLLRLAPRTGNPHEIAMEGWLRELGLEPERRFEWDKLSPQTQRGLVRAVADAQRMIAARMPRLMPIVNQWQIVRLSRSLSAEPMIAASGAMLGLLWNPLEINSYDVAFTDGEGSPLHGSRRYVLKFSPPPPVEAFWSVTMYSAENRLFVANPIHRYSIGDRTPGTIYGDDGSIEIFLQHEEPTDPRERANWLPAPAGPFYVVSRHYSPRPEIKSGQWIAPPVLPR